MQHLILYPRDDASLAYVRNPELHVIPHVHVRTRK